MPADLWCLGGWEEVPECMKQRLKVETYISKAAEARAEGPALLSVALALAHCLCF